MANKIEAVINTFKKLIDNEPKNPLHVSEVSGIWLYATALNESLCFEEIGLNTTQDDELYEALEDGFKMCHRQLKEVEYFMK